VVVVVVVVICLITCSWRDFVVITRLRMALAVSKCSGGGGGGGGNIIIILRMDRFACFESTK